MGRCLRPMRIWLCPAIIFLSGVGWSVALAAEPPCPPTRADSEGPFYKPRAPFRASTGRGLTVRGTVQSTGNCRPIAGATIEWWQASPQGVYDDDHRGAVRADEQGRYSFETDFPGKYPGRPPHIHLKVFAPGYRPLTTQLYLERGQTDVTFSLVLVRE